MKIAAVTGFRVCRREPWYLGWVSQRILIELAMSENIFDRCRARLLSRK
jgi:hypothetical protein